MKLEKHAEQQSWRSPRSDGDNGVGEQATESGGARGVSAVRRVGGACRFRGARRAKELAEPAEQGARPHGFDGSCKAAELVEPAE